MDTQTLISFKTKCSSLVSLSRLEFSFTISEKRTAQRNSHICIYAKVTHSESTGLSFQGRRRRAQSCSDSFLPCYRYIHYSIYNNKGFCCCYNLKIDLYIVAIYIVAYIYCKRQQRLFQKSH